ncbi:MAG TPA: hydroxymethylbilane synthase [Candidatus Binataceae bacterium]|nr:hydroxymethylbilane synthase [Candidatus Binataceae bacterium]
MALRLGSRPSALALAQAEIVRARIVAAAPDLSIDIVPIRTSGDRMTRASLARSGGKGLFIKELEQALADRKIDIAVHSMKDLPAVLPGRFRIAAVPEREDTGDALVTRDGAALHALPRGTRLGTSSIRRRYQAMRINPGLAIEPLRGNVDTRLNRVADGGLDAIIVAIAGLKRLGRATGVKYARLGEDDFIPAGGQGALAIEMLARPRTGPGAALEKAVVAINDPRAFYETAAERAFLATLGASCTTPIGVRAAIADKRMMMRSILFSSDGKRELAGSIDEPLDTDLAPSAAEATGTRLAEQMLARGAGTMLTDA